MGSLTESARKTLAKAIGKLAEETTDSDLAASARGLIRVLAASGCTILDLMALIEHGAEDGDGQYSEAEVMQVYQSGFVDGQKSTHQQQIQPYQVDWRRIASAIAPYVDELDDRDRDLVRSVFRQLHVGRDPSPKQAPWFRDIYLKLGRRHGFTATI